MVEFLGLILVLLYAVVVHEFGHLVGGRACGMKALSFNIGFGPKLLKWRDRHGTDWIIRPIPLGGFVQFGDSFDAVSPLRKTLVAIAGPAANLLTVLVIYLAIGACYGGLGGLLKCGLTFFVDMPHYYVLTLKGFLGAFTGHFGALQGPVGVVKTSVDVEQHYGFWMTQLNNLFVINIGLGLANLAPLPMLDGGHVIMAGIEAVAGKRIAGKIKKVAWPIGAAIIVVMMVLIYGHDIFHH